MHLNIELIEISVFMQRIRWCRQFVDKKFPKRASTEYCKQTLDHHCNTERTTNGTAYLGVGVAKLSHTWGQLTALVHSKAQVIVAR